MFVDRVVKESAQGVDDHIKELQACQGDLTVCTEQLSNCQKKCAEAKTSKDTCKPCECEKCKKCTKCKCETCKCEPCQLCPSDRACYQCPTFGDFFELETGYKNTKKLLNDSQWKLTRSYIVGGSIILILVCVTTVGLIYYMPKIKDVRRMQTYNNKLYNRILLIEESLKEVPIRGEDGRASTFTVKDTRPKIYTIPYRKGQPSFIGATVGEDPTVYGFFREKLDTKGIYQKGLQYLELANTLDRIKVVGE